MGKFLKFALIGVLIIFVICGVVYALLPSDYEVSRELVVDGTPAEIQEVVHDLRTWPEWSHWSVANYPSLKYTYSGEEKGVGAASSWTMDEGPGSMTVTASSADGVWYDLTFGAPEAAMHSKGVLEFSPQGEKTLVAWTNRGDLNGPWRLLGVMMDSFMGPSFEESLTGLQTRLTAAKPSAN